MLTTMLLLVVSAAPAPAPVPSASVVKDVAPGEGFHRVHPRRVSATSVLKDTVYRFEQNYLPVYAVDDAPDTAWVEGVKGAGVGEALTWVGPGLTKVKALKLYVRNGLQASKRLFDANARLRRLRIEVLPSTNEQVKDTVTPYDVELKSAVGWQQVEVPTGPAVGALRLTIQSVYKGTVYEDTCLSDVQVWVAGDDDYSEAAETAALDALRKFIASRAELKPKLAEEWASKPLGKVPCELTKDASAFDRVCLEGASAVPAMAAAAGRLRGLLQDLDWNAMLLPHGLESDADWTPVTVQAAAPLAEFDGILGAARVQLAPSALLDRRKLTVRKNPVKKEEDPEVRCGRSFSRGPLQAPTMLVANECIVIYGRSGNAYEDGPTTFVFYDGDLARAIIDRTEEYHPVLSTARLLNWQGSELASVVTFDWSSASLEVREWTPKKTLKAPGLQ